jgi:hypothetical protein
MLQFNFIVYRMGSFLTATRNNYHVIVMQALLIFIYCIEILEIT